jgi:hypothetical protein
LQINIKNQANKLDKKITNLETKIDEKAKNKKLIDNNTGFFSLENMSLGEEATPDNLIDYSQEKEELITNIEHY